ncbi:MAG: tandem-95 repeat protein, partial [Pseudomonadota bacterium]
MSNFDKRKLLDFRPFRRRARPGTTLLDTVPTPAMGTPLEPRVLLDAALLETADSAFDAAAAIDFHDLPSVAPLTQEQSAALGSVLLQTDAGAGLDVPSEIVFIDPGVGDIATLLDQIDPAMEVIVLDSSKDGVQQIADILSTRENVGAVHIISHGSEGELELGNDVLTEASMSGLHADALDTIADALHEDGDILVYGCNFGSAAATTLSKITGADVAASSDLTGSSARGGDWDLEVVRGEVTAEALEADAFSGVLSSDQNLIGYDLDGSENLYFVDASNQFPSTDFTYEVEYKTSDNNYAITSYERSGNDFLLYSANGSTLQVYMGSSVLSVPVDPTNGVRVTVTLDSTLPSNQLKLYVDGVLAGQASTTTTVSAGGHFAIGQEQDGAGSSSDTSQAIIGQVYNARMWSSVLSSTDILNRTGGAADVMDFDFSDVSADTINGETGTVFDSLIRATHTAPDTEVALVHGLEDGASIPLGLTADAPDRDGPWTAAHTLSGLADGVTVTDGTNSFTASAGSTSVDVSAWTLADITAAGPANSDVDISMTLNTSFTDTVTSEVVSDSADIQFQIRAVADAGTITGTDMTVGDSLAAPISNYLSFALADTDGSETGTITLTGVPASWVLMNGAVTLANVGGTVSFAAADLANITLAANGSAGGSVTITATLTSTEGATGNQVGTATATSVPDTFTLTVTANDAPQVLGEAYTIEQSTSFNGSVATNDFDPDGDSLTYAVATGTTYGDLVLNPNGTFTYQPQTGYVGSDTFQYTVDDGNGGVATQTVTITIERTSDKLSTSGPVTTNEDTPVNLGLSVAPDVYLGGNLQDVIGTATGFRAAGSLAGTQFDLPADAKGVTITAFSNLPTNTSNEDRFNDDYQILRIRVDLATQTFSGILGQVDGSAAQSDQFAFQDVPFGTFAGASGSVTSGDGTYDTEITIRMVDADTFEIVQRRDATTADPLQTSYLAEFVTPDGTSANFLGANSGYQDRNQTGDIVINIPAGASYIMLNEVGAGTDANYRVEHKSFGRTYIDLSTELASGTFMAEMGETDARTVAYGFTDYNVNETSPDSILASAGALTGDTTAASYATTDSTATTTPSATTHSAESDQTYYIRDNGDGTKSLVINRNSEYANNFRSMYTAEFYERVNYSSIAAFVEVESDYGTMFAEGSGSVPQQLFFDVPDNARVGIFQLSLSTVGGNAVNENMGSAFAVIDFQSGTSSGAFNMNRASTPDLVSWDNVEILNFGTNAGDPVFFNHPNTQSNHASAGNFSDAIAANAFFELITNPDGSQQLKFETYSNDGTQTYRDYYGIGQVSFLGKEAFVISGSSTDGTLQVNRGGTITPVPLSGGNYEIDPEDIPFLEFLPDQHFSGEIDFTITLTSTGETETVPVKVLPVVDVPALTVTGATGLEDSAIDLSGAFSATLIDQDGSETIVGYTIDAIPAGSVVMSGGSPLTISGGSVTITPAQLASLTITPPADFNGDIDLSVAAQIQDDDGLGQTVTRSTNPQIVTVTVTPDNDGPTANDDSAETGAGQDVTINVLANDSDIDGDTLTVTEVGGTAISVGSPVTLGSGTVVALNADGTLTLTPGQAAGTSEPIVYTVSDGTATTTATATLVVHESGDALYSNSGTGNHPGSILWLNWEDYLGGNGDARNGISDGDVVVFDLPLGGKLKVTFSATSGVGGMYAADMNTWSGSQAHNEYNTAGSGEALYAFGTAQAYTMTFEASLNGQTFNPDVLFTDAEANATGEQHTVVTNGDAWQLIENLGPGSTNTSGEDTNTAVIDESTSGTPLYLSENASQLTVSLTSGNSATAFGILWPRDFGDVAGYGDAWHFVDETAVAGTATGLEAQGVSAPFLGTAAGDADVGTRDQANSDPDANDDSISSFPTLAGNSTGYQVDVTVNNPSSDPATVGAWIDFDNNGTFDADEYASAVVPANTTNGTVTLFWTGLNAAGPDVHNPGANTDIGMRVRISTDTMDAGSATGGMSDGEVEDYLVTLQPSGGANNAPNAVVDTTSVTENTAQVAVGNVLGNDTDTDGHTLTVSDVNGTLVSGGGTTIAGTYGTLTIAPDGSYSYTLGAAADVLSTADTPTEVFTYTASDGFGGAATATLTVNIQGTNDTPDALSKQIVAAEESTGTLLGLPAPTDAENDTLTITVNTRPTMGVIKLADGTPVTDGMVLSTADLQGLQYDAPGDYLNGQNPGDFIYTVSDGNSSENFTVDIVVTQVNDAPTAQSKSITVDEESGDTAIGLTLPSDPDGDALTITITDVPNVGLVKTSAGTVLSNGDTITAGQLAALVYEAPEDYTAGVDPGELTYSVDDGTTATTGLVDIIVSPVNDAPVTYTKSISVGENSTDNIVGLTAPTDADGDGLVITVTGLPTGGSITLANGTPLSINQTLNISEIANLQYDAPAIAGNYGKFTYEVDDTTTVVTGEVNVSVQTTPVAPTTSDRTITAFEDTPYVFSISDFPFSDANPGDTLSNVRVDSLPAVGQLRLNGSAVGLGDVLFASDISAGRLSFVPAADASGTGYAAFDFAVSDGSLYSTTQTMTVDVAAVNDAPVLSGDLSIGGDEGAVIPISTADLNGTDADDL